MNDELNPTPDVVETVDATPTLSLGRRLARWAKRIAYSLLALLLVAYLVALGAQAWSVHEALQYMQKIKALRPGMPATEFQKIADADITEIPERADDDGATLVWGRKGVKSPSLRILYFIQEKMPGHDAFPSTFMNLSDHMGLRYWFIRSGSHIKQGRIVDVEFILGASNDDSSFRLTETAAVYAWSMGPYPNIDFSHHKTPYADARSRTIYVAQLTQDQRVFGLYEGFTSQSTPDELAARQLRTSCLFFVQGCRYEQLLKVTPASDAKK